MLFLRLLGLCDLPLSLTENSGPLSMTQRAVVETRRSDKPKKLAQIVSVPPGSIVPVKGRKSKILLIGGGLDWPSKAKGNSSSPVCIGRYRGKLRSIS